MTCAPTKKRTDRQIDRYVNKKIHTKRVYSRMRRSVTAGSIPTKFCTSTLWGGRSNIFDMTSKLVEGFRSGSVRKWASPIDFSFDVTLWPWPLTFDLEQLQFMAGHVTNLATKLEYPMPIRSWFMRYNFFHSLLLVTIENAYAATAHAPSHVTHG